jgi:hypothetical protein
MLYVIVNAERLDHALKQGRNYVMKRVLLAIPNVALT